MNRPSIAAAFAASLLFAGMSQGIARDRPWVEPAHAKDAGLVAELRLLGVELPPLHDQPAAAAGLRDHLHFIELASVNGLLQRNVAIEITPPQPLIAIADNVPPPVASGPVPEPVLAQGQAIEDRMLGDGLDDERLQAYLPFARELGVAGVISGGSFEASAVAAGVPAPAMLDAVQALETSVDLKKEMRDGHGFYVRYQQTFTQAGAPLDVGRVLWMELRTPKGVMAIHRFRSRDNTERFWMANGQAATPPSFRLPLDTVSISSGFGLRADPFDQPPRPYGGKPQGAGGPKRPPGLPPGLPTGASSYGSSSYGGFQAPPAYALSARPSSSRSLFMHEGVDLVAPTGTPVVAAADGLVVGAAPNGRYGNWIRLEHGGKLASVYGHLSAFATGLQPGMMVSRGDVIGYVGSTGRSTGAHLHFELQVDGKPVNPITHPELKRAQLRGPDFERFRKQVAASLVERELEARPAAVSVGD
ncbi:M23 family metallopeptidase [Reyranella sp.]|uniref:M23 family metallopeptidase n=1 Tax=Reyranella sp. TaxID=1929291 RepID=UPI00271A6411|nr:M23 family metallopeptidase [Reyranella sp.]MDO8974590.1 M23 family metallopeptidase [Reyranella sp.]